MLSLASPLRHTATVRSRSVPRELADEGQLGVEHVGDFVGDRR